MFWVAPDLRGNPKHAWFSQIKRPSFKLALFYFCEVFLFLLLLNLMIGGLFTLSASLQFLTWMQEFILYFMCHTI